MIGFVILVLIGIVYLIVMIRSLQRQVASLRAKEIDNTKIMWGLRDWMYTLEGRLKTISLTDQGDKMILEEIAKELTNIKARLK